ncbi:PIN domain-containing protein [Salinisphaera sp. P385]|uniref:PIN domain-containing protein n=1 Tax=Spectribacter acetivorans TaxID=3075603 RepID=A0ABU3B9S7_9GAMM|nr:PIN domain-containing protein [Salinisphaera sp. P385]MDT0619224.1 PIN domain-containing protein [Salinisphaera sp. P385]
MLFWDACAVIYFVDNIEPWASRLSARLLELDSRFSGHAVSELSLLECRIKPLREQNAAVLAAYDRFFSRKDLLQVPVNKAVILEAARVRAAYNLKTPDAFQAASALSLAGEVLFVTNDRCFDKVLGLRTEIIE